MASDKIQKKLSHFCFTDSHSCDVYRNCILCYGHLVSALSGGKILFLSFLSFVLQVTRTSNCLDLV
jgi:hypothetical protein